MQKETWVVVANKETARIFEVEKFGSLKEIHTMVHPKSGLKVEDMTWDGLGVASDGFRTNHNSMEPATSPKMKEAQSFAKQIAKFLELKCNQSKFNRMFLMAEPSFLGVLRRNLNSNTLRCLEGEVSKDLTKQDLKGIWNHMPVVS